MTHQNPPTRYDCHIHTTVLSLFKSTHLNLDRELSPYETSPQVFSVLLQLLRCCLPKYCSQYTTQHATRWKRLWNHSESVRFSESSLCTGRQSLVCSDLLMSSAMILVGALPGPQDCRAAFIVSFFFFPLSIYFSFNFWKVIITGTHEMEVQSWQRSWVVLSAFFAVPSFSYIRIDRTTVVQPTQRCECPMLCPELDYGVFCGDS